MDAFHSGKLQLTPAFHAVRMSSSIAPFWFKCRLSCTCNLALPIHPAPTLFFRLTSCLEPNSSKFQRISTVRKTILCNKIMKAKIKDRQLYFWVERGWMQFLLLVLFIMPNPHKTILFITAIEMQIDNFPFYVLKCWIVAPILGDVSCEKRPQ